MSITKYRARATGSLTIQSPGTLRPTFSGNEDLDKFTREVVQTFSNLRVSSLGNTYISGTSSGSSPGAYAPNDATYLVLTGSGLLTNERIITPGANISFSDAGPSSPFTINSYKTPIPDDIHTIARWIDNEEEATSAFDWPNGTQSYVNRVSGGTASVITNQGTLRSGPSVYGSPRRSARIMDASQGIVGGQAIGLTPAWSVSFFVDMRNPVNGNVSYGNAIIVARSNIVFSAGLFSAGNYDFYVTTTPGAGSVYSNAESSVTMTVGINTTTGAQPLIVMSWGTGTTNAVGILPYYRWSHIAVVFNPAVNTLYLYRDGEVVNSVTTTGVTRTNTASHRWVIGSWGGTTYCQPMFIERIIVSDIARTPGEIRAEAFSGLGG